MIRTYPDGSVYESDLTDIELRHPDNAVAMELVEVARKVSRRLEAVEAEFSAYEFERTNELKFIACERKAERKKHAEQVGLLTQAFVDIQAKLDAIKAVLA